MTYNESLTPYRTANIRRDLFSLCKRQMPPRMLENVD